MAGGGGTALSAEDRPQVLKNASALMLALAGLLERLDFLKQLENGLNGGIPQTHFDFNRRLNA